MYRRRMLQFLRIRNLALLDAVDLEFESGFTAMTGETGAGKSILLGALGLLAGSRADKSQIRQGVDTCEVEAGLYFADAAGIDRTLGELNLPPCEDGVLLIKRTIPREKAPRITVNGSMATLANVQALGELWIDFHGPGEPRRLLKGECQIELLDLYGQLGGAAQKYRDEYESWRQLVAEIERVTVEARLDPDQIDFLRQQIAKIETADLDPEAVETLERDFNRLSKAQELADVAGVLVAGLGSDEGILNALAPLVRAARELAALDPAMEALAARMESLAVESEDLSGECERFVGGLDFDPDVATDLHDRMTVMQELKRKYGPEISDIRDASEKMQRRVSEQADLEGTVAHLRAESSAAEKRCRDHARALRRDRKKAGNALVQRAVKILRELGFAKAELTVSFAPDAELRPYGDARPEFLFSPNVGESPLPLAQIASSGELARVMLALKTVLAEVDDIPVLVFDEVDANVGGEIGRVVGEKMAAIAKKHQVLCVTHLPQVASLGAQHFVVDKDQRGARAVVTISALHPDKKARVGELARMLGDRSAKSAQAHARELLAERCRELSVRRRSPPGQMPADVVLLQLRWPLRLLRHWRTHLPPDN